MRPSGLCCWLVVLLVLRPVSHGQNAIDQTNMSQTSAPANNIIYSSGDNSSSKSSSYNKSKDVMYKIPQPLADSPKHQQSLTFPVHRRHKRPPDLERYEQQRFDKQEQKSRSKSISSALGKEQVSIKGPEGKKYDENFSKREKLRDRAEGLFPKKRAIRDSSKRLRGTISPFCKDVFSGDGQTDEYLFQCGPNNKCTCVCRNFTKTLEADCTRLNLRKFPKDLPQGVQIIDASHNKIEHLSLHSLSKYADLEKAYVSFNKIKRLTSSCSIPSLSILNLDSNDLKSVNSVKFGGLGDLKELHLSKNKIRCISHQLLLGLKSLQSLDLSYNNLSKIDVTAFDSLVKLETLRLDNNKRLGYSNATLPARLFKHLQALKFLWIQGNAKNTTDRSYPNEALAQLTNLMELNIDGLGGGVELGPQIKKLTRLHSLVIGFHGNCFIKNMSSTFFQYVPFLLKLTFVGCPFKHVENGTFEKLDKLVNYTFAFPWASYKFEKALKDLQGLSNRTLTDLALVGFMRGRTKCRTLSSDEGKFISRFNLRNLYLQFNYISNIDADFIDQIPKTLQKFQLRGNKFTFIDYRWNLLMNFTNLYEIDIRDQNMYSSDPLEGHWFGDEVLHEDNACGQHMASKCARDIPLKNEINNNYLDRRNSVCNDRRFEYCKQPPSNVIEIHDPISHADNSQCNPNGTHQACIPPNLKVIRASGFTEFGRAILFDKRSKNSLCFLDFSSGFFTDWGNGTFPSEVKIADFSNNLCGYIKKDFFPPNNQLRYLCIDNNYLGPVLSDDVNGEIFSQLQSLKYLNIAMNNVFTIPPLLFKGLKSLETFDMHDNKLQILDVEFSLTPNLKEIDLSKNSITWITRRSRRELDSLAMNHSISINLLYNPLPCTCDGVEILQWLANTRVVLKYQWYLTCNSDTGEQVPLGNINKRIRSLNRKCIPNSDLVILSSFSCFIFLLVILYGLLYKHRWKLIYARNIWLVNMFGFRPIGEGTSQRLYDAYVVYSEEDRDFALNTMIEELEVKRGHKLCVEDRDFIPGNFNFNNIICAVQNSTITLLLLSPDFLNTGELEYATQMALMEQQNAQENRDVILLFRYKEIPAEKLTKDLLTLMREGHFLDYPRDQDESIKQRFWDRVSTEVGHTQNINTPGLLSNIDWMNE